MSSFGDAGRGCDAVGDDRVLVPDQGNPAEPGYQVRLAVAVDPASKTFAVGSVSDLRLVLGAIFDTVLILRGEGLQHRRQGVPAQSVQAPDVCGEPVVADGAPVFGRIGLDDVVVVQVLQPGPVPGFVGRR